MAVQNPPNGVGGFEWDEGNRDKCQKHGVPLALIEAFLRGPFAALPDPADSPTEVRFKAIALTDEGRGVLVVFTLRTRGDRTFIRPPSARYMHRKEVAHYEETIANSGKRYRS